MKTLFKTALPAVLMGAMAVPALAQERGERDRDRRPDRQQQRFERDQRQDQQQTRRRTTRGQVTGEVVQTKRVDIRGTDRQHLVVLLKTERGKRVPVDLGSPARLGRRLPSVGDKITVKGRLVRIGDRGVIVGEELRAGERVVRIQHSRPQADERRQDIAQRRQQDDRERGYRQQQDRQRRTAQQQEQRAGLGVRLAYDRRVDGVRVLGVVRGSPAAEAGLRPGDVIVAVNNTDVTTPQELIRVVSRQNPGEQVDIEIRRNNQSQELTAELTTRQQALERGQQQSQRAQQDRGVR